MRDAQAEPAAMGAAGKSTSSAPGLSARLVSWSAAFLLAGYAILLFSHAQTQHEIVAHGGEITLRDLVEFQQWILDAVRANVVLGLHFLALGILAGVAIGHASSHRRALGTVGRWGIVAIFGIGFLVLLSVVGTGRSPGVLGALLPGAGYLLGLWIGRTLLRGLGAGLWLVPKLLLIAFVLLAGAGTLALLATDAAPLDIKPPKVTSAEKRRLVDELKRPRSRANGTRRLRLTERDLNLILAMGLDQVLPGARGRIILDEGTVSAALTLPVTGRANRGRHLNVQTSCNLAVADGRPEIRFIHCSVGQLTIPRILLADSVRKVMDIVYSDRDLSTVMKAVGSLQVSSDAVETVLVSGGLLDNVMPSLMARFGQNRDVVLKTAAYYEDLLKTAETLPREEQFVGLLQSTFARARTQSASSDPVLENRAAILALAIMLGHHRVEHLVGPVTDESSRRAARRYRGRVPLRGRNDWCRHFLVSAALAILSNESLSDEAGLFKEELDAGEGGSGFSFSDLLADRAGTLFALSATRDESSARQMQHRLADGFDLDVIFPEAADLPEGIPDARFEAEYGGVGGEKYRQVVAEIERRLATCEGLR